jgi:hypothetical protein
MVPRPTTIVGTLPSLPAGYEQHKTIDEYYKRLGSRAPIQSLVQEVADNQTNANLRPVQATTLLLAEAAPRPDPSRA